MIGWLNISIILFIIGLILLIVSNVMYYRRTRDKDYIKKFWLSKSILTKSEYYLNRVGFAFTCIVTIGMASIVLVIKLGLYK